MMEENAHEDDTENNKKEDIQDWTWLPSLLIRLHNQNYQAQSPRASSISMCQDDNSDKDETNM